MVNKVKRSIVWIIPTIELENFAKRSTTLSQLCDLIGIGRSGGSKRSLLLRIEQDEIDITHIPRGYANNLGICGRSGRTAMPLDIMLVEDSPHDRGNLKRRLISNNLIANKCSMCSQEPIWNGEPLVLALDHMNGINNDNRIENLRLLCPNCHSQTSTFAGRNSHKDKIPTRRSRRRSRD